MNDLRKAAEMALDALNKRINGSFDGVPYSDLEYMAVLALRQAIEQAEKPPVKSYCGGVPNYCAPQPEVCCGEYARCLKVCIPKERWFAQQKLNVDAVNISAERVDETAKGEHDLWIAAACLKSTVEAAIKAGDWKVDGACDPTRDLQYLANCFSSIQNREWVGLTDEDKEGIKNKATYNWDTTAGEYASEVQALTEAKLKEKNGG